MSSGAVMWELSGHWFVWTKKGRQPKFAHATEDAARAEAERLARLHPGQKFHLMQSAGKAHVPTDATTGTADDAFPGTADEIRAALSRAQGKSNGG